MLTALGVGDYRGNQTNLWKSYNIYLIDLYIIPGGEGGIRTRVGVTNPLTAFEAAPL